MNRLFTLLILGICVPGSAMSQYCMLTGRTSYSTNQPGITQFQLNTINRTSMNVESALTMPPVVVTGDSTKLVRGQTYTVTIKHNEDSAFFPGARNNLRIWIDYNMDGDFMDANESASSKDLEAKGTSTLTFTVPTTAPLGTTRLRATVKMSADAGHTLPSPCDEPADPLGYHGEMEDYIVNIVTPTSVNETTTGGASFSVSPNPATSKITIDFTEVIHNPVTVELLDAMGKQIATLLKNTRHNLAGFEADLSKYFLAGGVYFIRVATSETVSYKKILIR